MRRSCSLRGCTPRSCRRPWDTPDISLTLDTYSHFVPSLQEKATLTMEEALGRPRDIDNSFDNNLAVNSSVPPTEFEPVSPS